MSENFILGWKDFDTLYLLCAGAIFIAVVSSVSYILWTVIPHIKSIKGIAISSAVDKHLSKDSSSGTTLAGVETTSTSSHRFDQIS